MTALPGQLMARRIAAVASRTRLPGVPSRFVVYQQHDHSDCAAACLRMVARQYGRRLSARAARELCDVGRQGASVRTLTRAAEALGFRALAAQIPFDRLARAPLPCIVHWEQRHFVVVVRVNGQKVHIADPGIGLRVLDRAAFEQAWSEGRSTGIGVFLEVTPRFYEAREEATPEGRSKPAVLAYLSPHKALVVQILLGLAFSALVAIVLPFLAQAMVDTATTTRDTSFIYVIAGAYLAMAAGKVTVDLIRMRLVLHVGNRVSIALVADFLTRLFSLPLAFFGSRRLSDILERIADHRKVEELLAGNGLSALFSSVHLAALTFVLSTFDVRLALAFAAGAALSAAWVWLWLPARRRLDHLRFAHTSLAQGHVIQMVTGIAELKLHDCASDKRQEWERLRIKLFDVTIRALGVEQLQFGGVSLITEATTLAITVLSVLRVTEGDMSLGMLVATQYVVGQMVVPLRDLLLFSRTAQDASLALDRARDVHEASPEPQGQSGALGSLPDDFGLTLSGVQFRYPGADCPVVLHDVSFSIPTGKLTAIVGTSGSGKSTLVRLLLRLFEPTEGSLILNGVDLRAYDLTAWRRSAGAVLQDGYLFEGTIAENVALGVEQIDDTLMQRAVAVANLADVLASRPLGLATRLGPNGEGLSQGQKQRVLIARAVYKQPRFFVFDEATSALDANNERTIVDRLDEVFAGRTAVVVAHRLSTVRHAHNIVVLSAGRVVEQGTHAELVQRRGAYFALVKNQLELDG